MGKSIRLEMRPQERTGKHAYFLPVVDSEHCTGCGRCENACILEEAAIKVLPHDVAKGRLGEHYRFGWKERSEISRDFTAPESAPGNPAWDSNLKGLLERMDDLSGIEEP
jgi:ferredoxin-type protein NapG